MSDPAEREASGAAVEKAAAPAPDAGSLHRAAIQALRAGQLKEAIDNLAKLIALSPRLAAAHNHLGAALFMAGRFDMAAA